MSMRKRMPLDRGSRQFLALAGIALAASCLLLASCASTSRAERIDREMRQAEIMQARLEGYLVEAESYRNEGNNDAALEVLAKAIEINPELFQAHMSMADIYRERGDNDFAIQKYRVATEINPQSYDAQYYLGLCLQLTNRLAEAIRAYRRAISIDPQSHEANLNIATAYLQSEQPAEALPFARRAAELQPDHGPTHINLAAVYAALGKHEDAVVQYRTAAELMELPPNVMLNFADSLRVLRRYTEMINTLEALLRTEKDAGAYERLGYALFKTRQYDRSRTAYQSAIDLEPTYYPAINGLAVNFLNEYILSGHEDTQARDEAVRLLRRSIQIASDQPRIIDLLSRYGRT